MPYFKKLVGENIYLSPRGTEDALKFAQWLNDSETADFLSRREFLANLENEQKWLEENINNEAAFVIVTLAEDKMIGTCSFENINHIDRVAELGIFIGDKEYRGKEIGTEAVKLLLNYGFNSLNFNSIYLKVMEFNPRAIACYKKCGFNEVGRLRQHNYINGKYYDSIYMDILKSEYQP